MSLPNFFIIGAQKCGTDALYDALRQHPEIYMSPEKEPSYFIMDGGLPDYRIPSVGYLRRLVPDREDYLRLFKGAGNRKAVGEASAIYLSSYFPERTAARIRDMLPDARLLALVRQPADRAYSSYHFYRARGLEPLGDFQSALSDEPRRIAEKECPDIRHRTNGCYYSNLKPYYDLFPSDRIKVFLQEDWASEPQVVLREIFRFLGVREDVQCVAKRLNVTTLYRNGMLRKYCVSPNRFQQRLKHFIPRGVDMRLDAWNRIPPPPFCKNLRRELTEGFREEITCLQGLIGRDLSHWLE